MPVMFLLIRCVVIPCRQQWDRVLDSVICYKQSLKSVSAPFVCKIPQEHSMLRSWMHHYCCIIEPSDNGGQKKKSTVIASLFQKAYQICWAWVNYSLGFYCNLQVESEMKQYWGMWLHWHWVGQSVYILDLNLEAWYQNLYKQNSHVAPLFHTIK